MKTRAWSLFTCVVNSALSPRFIEVLEEVGLCSVYSHSGKQLCLEERRRPLGLADRLVLAEDRAELFRFAVPSEYENGLAGLLAESCDLRLAGRGAIFTERLVAAGELSRSLDERRLSRLAEANAKAQADWCLLTGIVHRGLGDELARSVLESGFSVPIVSYGDGVGLRDRLGLLRITIPVEKELVQIVIPEREAALVEGLIARKARLDVPGMGFLYRQRIQAHVVNRRISRGRHSHMASMDQVVAALDELRGSAEWRRRAESPAEPERKSWLPHRPKPGPLVRLSILADEEVSVALARKAMDLGAGGATLTRLRALHEACRLKTAGGSGPSAGFRAWSCSELVFDQGLLAPVRTLLDSALPASDGTYWVSEVAGIVSRRPG